MVVSIVVDLMVLDWRDEDIRVWFAQEGVTDIVTYICKTRTFIYAIIGERSVRSKLTCHTRSRHTCRTVPIIKTVTLLANPRGRAVQTVRNRTSYRNTTLRRKLITILTARTNLWGVLIARCASHRARVACDDRYVKIITRRASRAVVGTAASYAIQHAAIAVSTVDIVSGLAAACSDS